MENTTKDDDRERRMSYGAFPGRIARYLIPCVVIVAVSGRAQAAGSGTAGSLPTGSWKVSKTHIDTSSPRTTEIGYDDPRVTGRHFYFSPEKLSYDMRPHDECEGPSVERQSMTAIKLVQQTMAESAGAESELTPKDYELPVSSEPIQVFWISCRKGSIGPVGPPGPDGKNWIAVLPGGRLALRWYDNTILTLAREDPKARPEPSFPCKKARSAAEKAICGSLELASLDQSVSRNYRIDLKEWGQDGADPVVLKWVRSSQKQWLKQREACAGDAGCLHKTMEDRLEDLAHAEKHGDDM